MNSIKSSFKHVSGGSFFVSIQILIEIVLQSWVRIFPEAELPVMQGINENASGQARMLTIVASRNGRVYLSRQALEVLIRNRFA